jgi:PAS domain S-box-containing protein
MTPATPIARLLIVDDEPAQMKALCETLELEGYATVGFTSAKAALARLREETFDLVLTDLMMPEIDGIAFLRAARDIDSDLVGIVMTGYGTIPTAVQSMGAGALDYILKPFKLSAVMLVLARALDVRRLRLENIHLHQAVGIYELSAVIQFTLDFETVLQKVADAAMGHAQVSSVAVLLPSENGTELRVAVARGENEMQDMGKRIPFSAEISRWVERSLERPTSGNELADIQSALPLLLSEMPGGTSVPMLAGGKFVGILNFASRNPGRPVSQGQIKALNILAGTAASALEAASLLEKVRSAELRYRSLSESACDVIFRYELLPTPRFTYVNAAATSVIGYSPEEHYADPELILKIVHPDDRHVMEALLRGDSDAGSAVTMRCAHRNGHAIWIEQRNRMVRDPEGRMIAVEGISRDITERRHLEDQLRQAQKMEAVGLLAGGVAHDFNNLLTVIIGYSDLILDDDAPNPSIADKLAQVKKAADQAAALTRQLLAFGRRQLVQMKVLDVNAIVENNSKMLRRIIGEDIEFVTILDPELGSVRADTGLVEQILMNLVVNARDAMPQGGRITLETRNVTRDEIRANDSSDLSVMLSVSDTGCGMDADTQSRIFEPFYTTKAPGKGTGLGLSIVYGIVKQSDGFIRVFSKPGLGTRFEILLPRTDEQKERVIQTATSPESTLASETILIVEDDAAVRQLICAILENGGYEVLVASDGNEALSIFERNEGRIGMILTDLIMPGMSGLALVESLRTGNRNIRVLYMSGYAGDAVARHGQLDPGIPFIQKPFSAVHLIARVREILASGIAVPEP